MITERFRGSTEYRHLIWSFRFWRNTVGEEMSKFQTARTDVKYHWTSTT